MLLSVEPCNFKLDAVAANIWVASFFWIYNASNCVALLNSILKIALFSCDCAGVVENLVPELAPSLSVNSTKLLYPASVVNSEVTLAKNVLLVVFQSAEDIKQLGDSSASNTPSLSSSISNKSIMPSPSVSLQNAKLALSAYGS